MYDYKTDVKSNQDILENSINRLTSQDEIKWKHEMQITKHKELLERRKQYGFNRGSITSQLKQHQIKPTEFAEYGRDDEFSLNSYHSPTLDNFNGSLQYRRKAKIFDKFVNVVNNKPEAGINFLDNPPQKLPYIYKQHSSNIPLKRERNLDSLLCRDVQPVNKTSQDSRRVSDGSMVTEPRGKNS
jgi:hypothetical protein